MTGFKHQQKMTAHIRTATHHDRDAIRDVHLHAFPEGENRLVATLATNLLGEATHPATITLVAEIDGEVVGHIAFSPVTADSDRNWLGYILAPLAVTPEHQKGGIGSKLIASGMERLAENGVNVLFVYGDPAYYGKFGFSVETAAGFLPPYELQYPFGWQAIVLNGQEPDEQAVRIACVAALLDPALW